MDWRGAGAMPSTDPKRGGAAHAGGNSTQQANVPTHNAPPFLSKTFAVVDDPTTDGIVSWGTSGTSFVVWKPPEFSRVRSSTGAGCTTRTHPRSDSAGCGVAGLGGRIGWPNIPRPNPRGALSVP
mmetsp:Transcript_65882/g.208513  ORF Transcript_65882/g.208513 Transcript_65882/m.208513 type:complete len:125 (+) Transcript_65882:126-500(+)